MILIRLLLCGLGIRHSTSKVRRLNVKARRCGKIRINIGGSTPCFPRSSQLCRALVSRSCLLIHLRLNVGKETSFSLPLTLEQIVHGLVVARSTGIEALTLELGVFLRYLGLEKWL